MPESILLVEDEEALRMTLEKASHPAFARVLLSTVVLILGVFVNTDVLRAENWPHWRGPSANGFSEE
jgi:hypothetical protein